MKSIIFASVMILAFSCKNKTEKESLDMSGAYTLLYQTINDGTKDSTYSHVKQLKIYTDDYMMYANVNEADSSASFGIGSYGIDSGRVVEYIIYTASDDTINNETSTFTLDIEKTSKGYKQVIADIEMQGKQYKLTEEYDSVGNSVKSPLDGAWKLVETYIIRGNDTIPQDVTEYKVYYGGHFIWGRTGKDSATNKSTTGIGYGAFETPSENKIKEVVTRSSNAPSVGRTFDIDIERKGSDEYTQIIANEAGEKSVELYKRLKKE